jgi:hypothetical protein
MGAKHPPSKDESWIWAGETMNLGAILETRSGCFSAMADSSGAPGPSPGRIWPRHARCRRLCPLGTAPSQRFPLSIKEKGVVQSGGVPADDPGVDAIAGMAIMAAQTSFGRL